MNKALHQAYILYVFMYMKFENRQDKPKEEEIEMVIPLGVEGGSRNGLGSCVSELSGVKIMF